MAVGNPTLDVSNSFRKYPGSTNVVIIAVHTGYNGMFQAECLDCFCDSAGFIEIDRLRTSLRNRTEPTPPCTQVSEQHECRGLVIPALPDVRALCRLAHSVQPKASGEFLEIVIVVPHRGADFHPLRLR